jgi:glycosyltransferase involved in cell wall biosynthesis
MSSGITVVIPTIPPRAGLLQRALASVSDQLLLPDAVSIAIDTEHVGAWETRQRALQAVRTEWVAFLDDDDEFMPFHLKDVMEHARETGADYAYSWFVVASGQDPFPSTHFTEPWDNANPRQTTMTVLVKTELAQSVGFQDVPGEDWHFTLNCLAAGATISHLVKRTWVWHHDSSNTSGRGDRW